MELVDMSHPYWIIVELSAQMSLRAESKEVTAASFWWKVAARNFIQNRIRKADRSFFENLGTLLAARTRVQDKAAGPLPGKIEEDLDIENDASDAEEAFESPSGAFSESNIDKFYVSLVYLSQHQIGSDSRDGCNQASILNYLQRAFKINDEVHQQALDLARKIEMQLEVEVIEAKELIAKDSNGKSDPFCTFHLDSEPTKKYSTSVKQETLSPVWKELFTLSLNSPKEDVLSLTVWDLDAAETVIQKISKVTEVKSFLGALKFPKELATANQIKEFIGECRIAVKDIPMRGDTQWYSLGKKGKSENRGSVRLKLSYGAEYDADVAFQEHRQLLRILLLNEIESRKVRKYYWCGRWSLPAEGIILQHSVQRGLLAENVALAQWVEYINVHHKYPLSFTVLKTLAVELLGPINNGLFSGNNLMLFWESAKELLHSCLDSIRKIRKLRVDGKNKIVQLRAILGLISTLNSFKKPDNLDLFPANMYNWLPEPRAPRTDVMEGLQETVIQGCKEWYDHVLKNNKPRGDSDEDKLNHYVKVIQLINDDIQQATYFYDMIFIEQINFAYGKTLFICYEKLITDLCMSTIKDICKRLEVIAIKKDGGLTKELALGTKLFQLYLAIQRYANRGPEVCPDALENMKIGSYQEWFRDAVDHWLDIVLVEVLQEIEKALEVDKLEPVDPIVQHSSSAVDTLSIFCRFKQFWTDLAWPDVEDSQDISMCSVEYASKVACKAENARDQACNSDDNRVVHETEFEVSSAWCFAINNIDFICTSIGSLDKDLGVHSMLESLATIETQQAAEACRRMLQLLIEDTIDTVKNEVMKLLHVIVDKMTPVMKRYLTECAKSIDKSSSHTDRLIRYLDANIDTLYNHLNKTNFQTVLSIIWKILLKSLYGLINDNLEKARAPSFFRNLHNTLQKLMNFFEIGVNGTYNSEILEEIEKLLRIHSLETAALIHRYNQERLQEQKAMKESEYGQLTVKAHFMDNSLNIDIMNANNLPEMDSNGECDPYVQIRLLPEEKFVQIKQPTTQHEKATRFPLFEKSFSISLSSELRETENAMIVFIVKDRDLLRRRFMAEAFLAFSEIREIGPDENREFLEQIRLTLSRPIEKDSDVIRALELRKNDERAVKFISKHHVKSKIRCTVRQN